ncbi:MAG: tetratricopeptide repeat protein [Burkholderiales bacterium]
MKNDLRGTPVTGADAFALSRYEAALEQFQTYVGDPVATIDEAVRAAPAFVAGHLFKALVLYTLAERKFVPMAAEALEQARRHAPRANDRELGLMAAAESLVQGRWLDACRALDRVLAAYPRDALALQVAHLMDFYRGDALNLRNRVSRVLPQWDASVPGYSYVLGMHAFGLEEMNQYAEAEATALRALSLQPKDGWAVHAAVHVMEMQGRIDDGIGFLNARESDWAPDNAFAFHNFWHLALFHLDHADFERALALFDRRIHPEPAAYVLSLIDATALLWRLRLEGAAVGDRFERVADDWETRIDGEPGFYAFNDAHAAMAFAATGRGTALSRLVQRMRDASVAEDANAAMTRDVGLPLAEGVAAFAAGRFADAIAAIEPMRDHAHRFGGSHAQRDLITLTLIEAAIRGGDRTRARHYIGERLVHKPGSEWGRRLWSRAGCAPSLGAAA